MVCLVTTSRFPFSPASDILRSYCTQVLCGTQQPGNPCPYSPVSCATAAVLPLPRFEVSWWVTARCLILATQRVTANCFARYRFANPETFSANHTTLGFPFCRDFGFRGSLTRGRFFSTFLRRALPDLVYKGSGEVVQKGVYTLFLSLSSFFSLF